MASARRSDYSEGFLTVGYDMSYTELEKTLDGIAKKAMPRAAAELLNKAAFGIRRELITYTETIFDKPNAYTKAAWVVDKAKSTDGPKMFAAVKARPKQAEYLRFQIFGGERHKGDAGSGPYDLFAYSAKVTQYGGVDRKYLKQLSKRAKTERGKRAALRAQRAALGPDATPKQRKAVKWITASRNQPGIFFGEVYGLKGYWQRPERYRAGNRPGPSWTKAGSHATLLFAVKSTIKNKPIFDYNGVVSRQFGRYMTPYEWADALRRAQNNVR